MSGGFSARVVTAGAPQVGVTRLEMEWQGVVEAGLNALVFQDLMQGVSALSLHHILVIDVFRVWRRYRDRYGSVCEDFVIGCSDLSPGVGPVRKMTQLDPQDSSLQVVHTVVESWPCVMMAWFLGPAA